MSAKWHRSRAWDDRFFPRAMWPAKLVLRAFSSILLAVILLLCVVVYVTLASVPIGMLAQIPTWLIYGVMAVVVVGVIAGVPVWVFWRFTAGRGRGLRLGGAVLLVIVLGSSGGWVWLTQLWPVVRYEVDAGGVGHGLLLFSGFCRAYRSTTLRRLPGMEMTELEFYAWWPLRLILLSFVLNMVTATVRRIEFSFKNLGVLTVHSGIVAITLGSIYYGGLKKEGDTLLLAGDPGADGKPTEGPTQDIFYDNTALSLYVAEESGPEQRPILGVPRYNDYNVGAFVGESALESGHRERPWAGGSDPEGMSRMLDIPVVDSPLGLVDPDLKFRIVGYAAYAEPIHDWKRVDLSTLSAIPRGFEANPLRVVYLVSDLPDPTSGAVSDKPVLSFVLLPRAPSDRMSEAPGQLGVEYTQGMDEARWRDLAEPLGSGVEHGIVVELPGAGGAAGERRVIAVDAARLPAKASVGGFEVEVQRVLPKPPFAIITEGYRGAQSSVAIVRVSRPGEPAFKPFTRYVYHRFGEINQDLLDEVNERGMPRRRNADGSIRLSYVDASQIQVYLDEVAMGAGKAPRLRCLVRMRGGAARVIDPVPEDGVIKDFVPRLTLRLGERWDHAEAVERPGPVPEESQDRSMIGTHDHAMLGVEVGSTKLKERDGSPWKTVVWLPFTKYFGVGLGTDRDVSLPDGRALRLTFGRRQYRLPGFSVQLMDFEMIAYDHRGAPRDYQSMLRVRPTGDSRFQGFEHVTKLNSPLTAPFHWDDDRAWVSNFFGRLASGLDPDQFKFSQAGWDQAGWQKTQQQADAGLVPRPFVSYTILGVGNNPGIHIIAMGGIMMGVGIPWAFYVKPYLVRREKKKIQAQLAAGTYVRPGAGVAAARAADQPQAETVGAGGRGL